MSEVGSAMGRGRYSTRNRSLACTNYFEERSCHLEHVQVNHKCRHHRLKIRAFMALYVPIYYTNTCCAGRRAQQTKTIPTDELAPIFWLLTNRPLCPLNGI